MDRPDIDDIKEEVKLFDGMTRAHSIELLEYALELELELEKLQKAEHNSKYMPILAGSQLCLKCEHVEQCKVEGSDNCIVYQCFEPKDAERCVK